MLAEQLKKDTLQSHQQLEKMLVGRMKAIRSKEDYVKLLQLFYTYFGGLEMLIDQYIGQSELSDYTDRRKSQALANDIEALGGKPLPKANDENLPQIQNLLQAYAALYVIEGSTLGGKIISKMMAQQLGINNGDGLSFFNGYGDDTENKWDDFKNVLNNLTKSSEEDKIVIDSANETFDKFRQWALNNA
jgi:heme oxygenase